MYRFTGSWLHKALVRLCAGMLAILGIKLSAFYLLGLLSARSAQGAVARLSPPATQARKSRNSDVPAFLSG